VHLTVEERFRMDAQCLKCGMQLSSPWSFCPQCGIAIAHEKPAPQLHEPVPAKGAFSGLYLGLIATPILVIVGTMLCLTGLGVILGIPMIIAGVLAPLAGPVFGMGEHMGKCPSCGTRMISTTDTHTHGCPVCNEKFALGDREAVGAK